MIYSVWLNWLRMRTSTSLLSRAMVRLFLAKVLSIVLAAVSPSEALSQALYLWKSSSFLRLLSLSCICSPSYLVYRIETFAVCSRIADFSVEIFFAPASRSWWNTHSSPTALTCPLYLCFEVLRIAHGSCLTSVGSSAFDVSVALPGCVSICRLPETPCVLA